MGNQDGKVRVQDAAKVLRKVEEEVKGINGMNTSERKRLYGR